MKVAVIYYSTYGHVVQMAESVKAGVDASGLAAATDIFQVPETLSPEVLALLHAPEKAAYPVATPEVLAEYDAFLFGIPTRFGLLPAQFKAFWDQTGGLWALGALYGKPAGMFVCTSGLGGGQESTAKTFLTHLVHHGMVYVPLGYGPAFPLLTNLNEVHGGSPWGAGALAGPDGSRQPSDLEKKVARVQGEEFSKAAVRFVREKEQIPASKEVDESEKKEAPKGGAEAAGAARATQAAPAKVDKSEGGCKCIIM